MIAHLTDRQSPTIQEIKHTFSIDRREWTFSSGKLARLSPGSATISDNQGNLLLTTVGIGNAREGIDFFPLSVDFVEKYYASGKIGGNRFQRREGRPSEQAILTSRLIDRPIRPLFPNDFNNEVQVICTVMSAEKNRDPDIVAMIGTSAALAISGVPFNGPIGAARVGYTDEAGYILNPSYEELKTSELDMVVAGTKDAVLMVESEANELPEDIMLGAVLYAHNEMQVVIAAINALVADAGKPRWEWQAPAENRALQDKVVAAVGPQIGEAYRITEKQLRYTRLGELRQIAIEKVAGEENGFSAKEVAEMFGKLEKKVVRNRILSGEPRIDGRDNRTVRAVAVEVGVLPSVHGSALFTRGETQAIVVATLGSMRDAQNIDALEGERKDPFMLHYNFPPYSVGECGRMGGTGRREIGHGRLARRGVAAMLPAQEVFPYSIRVVSEITESNGSSSMASVCGSSLALMDAGVPLKAPVAGIAMGLIKDGNRFAVLTDILGDEDHLGDMDFKVAGTANGITALQMDIKIEGINEEIMDRALEQALAARLQILAEMNKVINTPRTAIAETAPRFTQIKIDPEKIRDLIGKGGATIRAITEATGSQIDIEDTGVVRVYAANMDAQQDTLRRIEAITAEAEIGAIYTGKVVRIVDFGAFVEFMPGKDGLVHISQICNERIAAVSDRLQEGQEVQVKVLDVDNRGRIKLSIKDAMPEEPGNVAAATAEDVGAQG